MSEIAELLFPVSGINRDCPLERKLVIPAKAGIQLIKERPRSGSTPLFCRLRRMFYLAGFPHARE
jgi:hypothetical protein